jgi:hypothetical protein
LTIGKRAANLLLSWRAEAGMARKRSGASALLDALPADGERRLMLAVLLDAIRAVDHQWPSAQTRQVSRAWLRDRAWIRADDPQRPFSFVNICDVLGLEAGYVRRCVLVPDGRGRRFTVRRYATRVEDTWLRLRKDRIGCRMRFHNRPGRTGACHPRGVAPRRPVAILIA